MDWPRPLTAGFRAFFPLAGLAALVIMARTVALLQGGATAPTDPFAWHGHEMLFGYVSATIAGFLLTAVPNWTGTARASGWPIAVLVVVWLIARIGMGSGEPPVWAVAADIAFLPAAAALAARPLFVRGKVRQWLPVAVALVVGLANGLWHLRTVIDAPNLGSRVLAFTTLAIALLIGIIGGRVVPAFTRNRLKARGDAARPRADDARDWIALVASALVAVAELGAPSLVGWLALVAALAHAVRLYGWCGWRVMSEPLLFVLHVGYGWLVVGYAARAAAMMGAPFSEIWGLHGLLVGAIGTMTLAMMARATLGHTGRPLRAGWLLTLAFLGVQLAAFIRLASPILGADAWAWAGTFWSVAVLLFLARCAPLAFLPRADTAS